MMIGALPGMATDGKSKRAHDPVIEVEKLDQTDINEVITCKMQEALQKQMKEIQDRVKIAQE